MDRRRKAPQNREHRMMWHSVPFRCPAGDLLLLVSLADGALEAACTAGAHAERMCLVWPTQIQHVELEAAQRALALFQALGNAHCFDPARCHPTMQNAFANLLFAELQQAGSGAAGPSGAQKAVFLSLFAALLIIVQRDWLHTSES